MRGLVLLPLALVACRSSAPYTLPAAALNIGVALGASAVQRSSGGCYATCVAGTVCNPKTGYCESPPALGPQVCEPQPDGTLRCAPASRAAGTPDGLSVTPHGAAPGTLPLFPLGVAPATGSAPPPPAEASLP